jgi:hypothetical protein
MQGQYFTWQIITEKNLGPPTNSFLITLSDPIHDKPSNKEALIDEPRVFKSFESRTFKSQNLQLKLESTFRKQNISN